MNKRLGNGFLALGAVLVLAALALYAYNCWEDNKAGQASAQHLSELVAQIGDQSGQTPETVVLPEVSDEPLSPEACVMREVTIDGKAYIGYLSIPALELELPILSQWSYENLETAPCRYTGTMKGEDLVLLAHNYPKHFGKLSQLETGDEVLFTDMDGAVYRYHVAATDVVSATAVAEITAGNHALTLFTCTYGGKSRVTIYCDRMRES